MSALGFCPYRLLLLFGEDKLARACSRLVNDVRFASEADNAKLNATDPKRTYSLNSPDQHLGGPR
jgi:hypothetical protein